MDESFTIISITDIWKTDTVNFSFHGNFKTNLVNFQQYTIASCKNKLKANSQKPQNSNFTGSLNEKVNNLFKSSFQQHCIGSRWAKCTIVFWECVCDGFIRDHGRCPLSIRMISYYTTVIKPSVTSTLFTTPHNLSLSSLSSVLALY